MFKKIFLFSLFLIFSCLVYQVEARHNLAGRILLQVESNGEAYYFHPESEELHFLGRPSDAFAIMREQGIGISNENLLKIPIADASAFEGVDSDGDGYDDYTELSNGYNPYGEGRFKHDLTFSKKNAGKIFLQVENNGEAWYINGEDSKRYFLGRPADAFAVMRDLGLGISDENLDKLFSLNKEEELIEEVPLDDKLIFAQNLYSQCQPMSLELMDEGVLYNLNNLGLSQTANYCNIEVSILNDPLLSDLNMNCQTPTINYFSQESGESGAGAESIVNEDYLDYVSSLPLMYALDIEEHQGEGNCSGELLSYFIKNVEEGEGEVAVNSEISSNSLKWDLVDKALILDVFATKDNLYSLEQTNFLLDEIETAVYKHINNEKILIKKISKGATQLFVDSKERVWLYNQIEGIGLYLLSNNNWYQFSQENSDLVSDKIRRIGENEEGIWVATDQGLNLLKDGQWTLFTYNDWYPEDNFTENNIKDLALNENYVLFSTAFENYILKELAFTRLEGADFGSNIYLEGKQAWFYDSNSYLASSLDLESFDNFSLEIEAGLEGLSPEDFKLKDIKYHNNAYWFLATRNDLGEDIVLVKLENNTAYYYYSKFSHGYYAKQLINFKGELYLNFANGFGLYKISQL